ncbi:MAG: hypothetical protein IK149_02925 [Oscillospiraceae bacterium]|nr:hypothetical protein [Oscillospiraceae bacterium]
MADRKRSRRSRFGLGMLLYALIFIVLLIALLRPLWGYLAAYEESGPDKAMQRYLDSMDEAHVRALSADFLAGLDLRFQDGEQAFEAVYKVMSGELRCSKKNADLDLMHVSYTIRSGDRPLGTVSIGKEEDPPFGFAPWVVENEDYDFSWLLGSDEITVPDSWTLRCGSAVLDESFRTGEQPFETLSWLYGDERFSLPVLVSYRVEGVLGEAPFVLLDSEGREVSRELLQDEFALLANCSEEQEARIRTLLDGFLQRYIDCLSNASRNVSGNYQALKPYILAGSDIDKRVKDNMEGQQWAHSGGDTVTARDDLLLMDLGGGYYMAELDYTLDTVGNRGHIESVNRVMVIMSDTADGLKVIEIYSL